MHARRRARREKKQPVDPVPVDPPAEILIKKPIPRSSARARRSFVRSIIGDPPDTDTPPIPDLGKIAEEGAPEIARALEAQYFVLEGICEDVDFLMRDAPSMRCALSSDIRLMMARVEEKLGKVDNRQLTLKWGKKEITFRVGVVIAILTVLGSLYDIPPYILALFGW